MALVLFLRGLNVGGHRTFRPSALARQLQHVDAVNIGAAGTFVIRKPVSRAQLRREVAGRLPFDAEIVICQGREIVGLMSQDALPRGRVRPDTVRFVSVLSRVPRSAPRLPLTFPSRGKWLLKLLARDGRFVFGLYRRHMKVIGYLGTLDRLFGVPVTTRNWNTITAIVKTLERPDPYDLSRFVRAQEGDYERALSEIRAGRKRSHWMWYIFPQFEGLGSSATSRQYAIRSVQEAEAYLRHPVLGPRLLQCAEAALGVEGRSASEVFGTPDDLKLRSCATLFAGVSPPGSVFDKLLDKFFGGVPDRKTVQLLRLGGP